jgi:hypothetical protein
MIAGGTSYVRDYTFMMHPDCASAAMKRGAAFRMDSADGVRAFIDPSRDRPLKRSE